MKKAILVVLACTAAAWGQAADAPVVPQNLIWGLALVMSLVHLSAPLLHPLFDRYNLQMTSLGGGAAITYVFMHLLPELDQRNRLVGGKIYGVVLLGYLLFYGVKVLVPEEVAGRGRMAFAQAALYNWLLVYGLDAAHFYTLGPAALGALALSFHLMHEDYALSLEADWVFRSKGRIMPQIGLACRYFFGLHEETLSSLGTALLAGIIMYNSFEDGRPSGQSRAAFPWFFLGSACFWLVARMIS